MESLTKEDFEVAFEEMLQPIRQLYSELTTRGSKFCYPFIYNNHEGDFLSYIVGLIKTYVERVKQLDEKSIIVLNHAFDKLPSDKKPQKEFDVFRDIDALSDLVIKVLTVSYKNYHDEAYQKLKDFFEADDGFYIKMLPQLHIERLICYRMRTGDYALSSEGELFHVPFEKRHLISSQRYSMPGYPMLYLAGSLFTAWCEMDKPELERMSFAGFQFKENALFVDLGYPYEPQSIWEWYSLFVMYPLLMACMVRVKYPSAPYKPEYIMPQLMTRLLRNYTSLFTGIAYMSNKLPESYPLKSITSRNFGVFTANNICMKGHDKSLAEKMQMTDIITLSREQIRDAVMFQNGQYIIDFKKIESICGTQMRDINVDMEVGEIHKL